VNWPRLIVFLAVAGLAFALFTPFCGVLFHCGCEGFWSTGSELCNVHKSGVPHCPFCATGNWGGFLPRGLILIAQALVVFIPSRISAFSRFAFGIVTWVGVETVTGFIFHWWTGYPVFL
jgi:hypothetical protein